MEDEPMANLAIQVALRRSRQNGGWKSYSYRVAHLCKVDAAKMRLLDPSESVEFEQRLFERTREGFSNNSISRQLDVPIDHLDAVVADACTKLAMGHVIVAPSSKMDFAFSLPLPPSPRQLRKLVLLDGDSVYVVSPDVGNGLGVDLYESESSSEMCFEVNLWAKATQGEIP